MGAGHIRQPSAGFAISDMAVFKLDRKIIHMEFDKEGHPVYFEREKLLEKAKEVQKRLVEIDAIRREYQ